MVIFNHISDIQHYLSTPDLWNIDKANIGFVPTMGALHEGHISLVECSKKAGDLTVCSIFVNPTQFNDKKDFEQYPVTIENDIDLLLKADCDVLFLPTVQDMYPDGFDHQKMYDFGYLEHVLEGEIRPGHFKGVGQVVGRFFELLRPQHVYLGQKDYQQCLVIKKLTTLMGINEIKVITCPTVREADGLAMSSRNRRLNEFQRAKAGIIYQCLVSIQTKQNSNNFNTVKKECLDLLLEKGFDPEYVALANANDLTLLDNYDSNINMVALIAAKTGSVRLIDNMLIN